MSAVAERATRPRVAAVIGWVAVIVVADQLTKSWIVAHLGDGHSIDVVGSFVQLSLTRNSGAAFSRFQGLTPLLAVVAIVIAVVLVRVLRRTTDTVMVVALVLVLGGALGNLADRVFRAPGVLRGHVVDFVKVGSFPLFNLADSCITVGAILLAVRSVQLDRAPRDEPETAGE